mgnify:CR=1 FL=1
MVTGERLYTAQDLWALAEDDKRLELLEGEIVEVSPAGDKHTEVGMWIGYLILDHAMKNALGVVSGSDGGYILSTDPDTVVAPDVGFLSNARLTPATGGYYPVPPDLAVEVISPNDTAREIRRKVRLYLRAGTRMVWVIYPEERVVDVYRPNAPVVILESDDTLDGGDVLPGFVLPVTRVFERMRTS